ncbi:MAG: helix-turn-helix domain-containing protein [Chitinivibrionales bacterium]
MVRLIPILFLFLTPFMGYTQDSLHVFSGKGVDSLINTLEIYDLSKGIRQNTPSPTLDSAEIVSPPMFTNLTSDSILFEIKPVCEVDTAILYARYYPWEYDTLAKVTSPPYSTLFKTASLPDQDAFQLQFGYILILPEGQRIISPPLPNRWVINRSVDKSDKMYRAKELSSDEEIDIDGDLKDWYSIEAEHIDSSSFFKLAWTPSKLYAGISVSDSIISRFDMVEITYDIGRTGGNFLDKPHRIMRFCPKGANFMWASEITNGNTSTVDSIIVLLKEETKWAEKYTESGYTMEFSIPISLLSKGSFPEMTSGFDVAIVNRDPGKKPHITTWSGVAPSERHNPESWGTVKLIQQMGLLKRVLIIVFILFGIIISFLIFQFFKTRKEESDFQSVEMEKYPEELESAIDYIGKRISDPEIPPEELTRDSKLSIEEADELFKKYTGTDIQGFILQKRIQKAKKLLKEGEKNLEETARICGFKSLEDFTATFKASLQKTPEEWREIRLREQEEQRKEDEEEEED